MNPIVIIRSKVRLMKKQTSQDLFTSPGPWNEGLIVDHLSNEFRKTQEDIARLEEAIDKINFSGSCTDPGNADCKYSEKVDCLIEMVGTVAPYGDITAFTKVVIVVVFGIALLGIAGDGLEVSYGFLSIIAAKLNLDPETAILLIATASTIILVVYLRRVLKTRRSAQLREALLLLRLRKKYQDEKSIK